MSKKIVIIGGMGAGTAVATRLRRLDENAKILILEKSNDISIASCALPYYIGDTITDRKKLLMETLSELEDIYNIDVRINSEVISVDTKNKNVTVKSKNKGVYFESYDFLILSTGASISTPDIKGIENPRIFKLRTITDADLIKDFINKKESKSAAIFGGEEIGIELTENLRELGLDIKLIEKSSHLLSLFDSDMSVFAQKELAEHGVDLLLNSEINSIEEKNNKVEIILNNGTKLRTDILIITSGLKPNTDFLIDSDINLSSDGYIITNERMETNIDNVYAIGDVTKVKDFVNDEKILFNSPSSTIKQARVVAHNINNINSIYKGSLSTSVIKIFNLTYAVTGNNEETLKNLGISYKSINLHSQSHDASYPNSTTLYLKLLFNDTRNILGAQAFGYDGVEKRIDVIATTIRLGGTIDDLTELELSYAPPYSSAIDPVNMAGYVAENVLRGKTTLATLNDIYNYNNEKFTIVDVRSKLEYEDSNIEGSINIPIDTIRMNLTTLDKSKDIVVYCQFGARGYIAERILSQHGFKVKNLMGGYETYAANKIIEGSYSNSIDTYIHSLKERLKRIDETTYTEYLDLCGMCCPGPLMKVNSFMANLNEDDVLKVTASDPGFHTDIQAWCKRTNNTLLHLYKDKGIITAYIKKIKHDNIPGDISAANITKDNKTLIVFSGDLDRAIASFIIANGALSMGKKVTMFFTFWGLNIIRKPEKVSVMKSLIDKLFGLMMPRGSKKLKLSKMNMLGLGGKMIRLVMKNKNISSLEELIKAAIDNGIELVACQMSMDVMGITKEELIDGIKIGGVAYYLSETEDSNLNLFI